MGACSLAMILTFVMDCSPSHLRRPNGENRSTPRGVQLASASWILLRSSSLKVTSKATRLLAQLAGGRVQTSSFGGITARMCNNDRFNHFIGDGSPGA